MVVVSRCTCNTVAGISIRLRILKDVNLRIMFSLLLCCRDIDPVEDTERA